MRLTKETIEQITNEYKELSRWGHNKRKLKVDNSIGGATIYADNWSITDVMELGDTIIELTNMAEAIKKVTGIDFKE